MSHLIYFLLNVLVFVVMPFFFIKLRRTPRFVLNYTYLGCVFVFSNIFGSIYSFRLSSSIQISGGNIAYTAILMTTLFMVIFERDLSIIRNLIYSILILNVMFFLLYQMVHLFLVDSSIVNPLNISHVLFHMTINIVIAGTILIIFELILMGILFEKIKKYNKNYVLISLVYVAVFVFILILDGLLFPIFAFTLDPNLRSMIVGGIQGKLILGMSFSIPILIFLVLNHEKLSKYIEQPLPLKDMILWPKRDLIQKIKESEEKYREAYNQAEFYKDLFAHDISNILQNIKSSVGLITMLQNKSENVDQIKEFMEIINEQVTRGGNMVLNIRKLSKLVESKKILESFNLIKVLKEAVQFVKNSYPKKNMNIQIQSQIDEIFVQANEFLLDVFENVVINAVNYNVSPKIEILIEISKEVKNDTSYVKIEIQDNGIGIPDKMKEKLFRKEIMPEDKSKRMGLGLFLVNKIIMSYNGIIWVENRVPGNSSEGSNIIILLVEVE